MKHGAEQRKKWKKRRRLKFSQMMLGRKTEANAGDVRHENLEQTNCGNECERRPAGASFLVPMQDATVARVVICVLWVVWVVLVVLAVLNPLPTGGLLGLARGCVSLGARDAGRVRAYSAKILSVRDGV